MAGDISQVRHYLSVAKPELALDALAKLPPESLGPDAYALRAEALGDLGRWTEADTAIRRALEGEPSDADYLASLGWIQGQLARTDDAQRTMHQAIALDPNNHITRVNLAIVLANAGRTGPASEALAAARSMQPDSIAVMQGEMQIEYARHDLDAALRAARRLLDRDPDNREALRVIAVTEAETGKFVSSSRRLRTLASEQLSNAALATAARQTSYMTRWWARPAALVYLLPVRGRPWILWILWVLAGRLVYWTSGRDAKIHSMPLRVAAICGVVYLLYATVVSYGVAWWARRRSRRR